MLKLFQCLRSDTALIYIIYIPSPELCIRPDITRSLQLSAVYFNMLEVMISVALQQWPAIFLLAIVLYLANNHYYRGLQKYPGPFLASLTDWWRFFDVLGRRPDITHNTLHKQYGSIVRLGPNDLLFADPRALKTIYGLNKGFTKVNDIGETILDP